MAKQEKAKTEAAAETVAQPAAAPEPERIRTAVIGCPSCGHTRSVQLDDVFPKR